MLLKIPFLIPQSVCFYIAFTPPNSPPPPKEQTGHRYRIEPYVNAYMAAGGIYIMKIISCMTGLAEIAVLLANEFPSHPVSAFILQNLLFPYNLQIPSAMYLTLPALVGSILVIAGGLLRLWCYHSLGDLFTFELSIREKHKLVTTGPYAYVRHPSYAGGLLAILGGFFVIFGRGGWVRESGVLGTIIGKVAAAMWVLLICPLVSVAILRPSVEDKALKDLFGKEWEDWTKRVPWRYIPEVY